MSKKVVMVNYSLKNKSKSFPIHSTTDSAFFGTFAAALFAIAATGFDLPAPATGSAYAARGRAFPDNLLSAFCYPCFHKNPFKCYPQKPQQSAAYTQGRSL
jgi:hypothetical protein